MVQSQYGNLSQQIDFDGLPQPYDRFKLLDVIGEGTYGEVYASQDLAQDKKVAVKIMENIADNIEEIEEEFMILKELSDHPNIPRFYGLYMKPGPEPESDQLWFVMELCSGGSVTDLVKTLKKRGHCLSERVVAYILRETMLALMYLHVNHCMHRDIKGHNILMTEDARIKLVDFGVSSHVNATMGRRNTSVGTPYWMAPEVIACERQLGYEYDVRCDIWSLGITAIELGDSEPPLSDLHPMRALFRIPRNPPPKLRNPDSWSDEYNDFVSECLVKDYEQRPSVAELLAHRFIEQVTDNLTEIREELACILMQHKRLGLLKVAPEVTTKCGRLKENRKNKPKTISVDDLANLESLSEEIIVKELCKRYEEEAIYTYVGDILIALNPFKLLPIYSYEFSMMYRDKIKSDNSPHIYAVADSVYHSMLHHKHHQCIVISGESGSGKTESANFLLKQLVFLGKAANRNLEDKILQVNPIIEAFGNAMTGFNDNSSRFGKFLDLTFTNCGKITGAKVSVYLLEQSRVVSQAENEKNFHIFYYLYDGLATENRLEEYYLSQSRKSHHRYLKNLSKVDFTSQENHRVFQNIVRGFQQLGFRKQDIHMIYSVLAAILHLGDIQFSKKHGEHMEDGCSVMSPDILIIVSDLLKVKPTDLAEVLITRSVVTSGEIIFKQNSVAEAKSNCDSMAKALYGRLFDWIVNHINRLLSLSRSSHGPVLATGLLDIFGFENFEVNSFEQLCINVANEQMQYYFNQHIFNWEQKEYKNEGINVSAINYKDNRAVLDMVLSRPMGLLALLDEESRFPHASDRSLVDKFNKNIKNDHYIRAKYHGCTFVIKHYAGKVIYNARRFLEKNRNFVPQEMIHILRQSGLPLVHELVQCPLTRTGNLYYSSPHGSPDPTSKPSSRGLASQTRAQQTVATYFRFSLMDLLQKMSSGDPHFVRCIKPNDNKQPDSFNASKVLTQLRFTGVLETVAIRRRGYSHRIFFADFLRRYSFLAFDHNEKVVASKENCRLLLNRLNMENWAIGKTKVFLKYYHIEYLSKRYEEEMKKIVKVQAIARCWLATRQVQRRKLQMVKSAVTLQKYARKWLTQKRYCQKWIEIKKNHDVGVQKLNIKIKTDDPPVAEINNNIDRKEKEIAQSLHSLASQIHSMNCNLHMEQKISNIPSRNITPAPDSYVPLKQLENIRKSASRIADVKSPSPSPLQQRSHIIQREKLSSPTSSLAQYYEALNRQNRKRAANRNDHLVKQGPKTHIMDVIENRHKSITQWNQNENNDQNNNRMDKKLTYFGDNILTKKHIQKEEKLPSRSNNSSNKLAQITQYKNGGNFHQDLLTDRKTMHESLDFNRNKSYTRNNDGDAKSDGGFYSASSSDEIGPFDFRRILKKTDHAPTDTLKRCKGLTVPANVGRREMSISYAPDPPQPMCNNSR